MDITKLRDWQWYDDVDVRTMFVHLLVSAATTERKWHGHNIKRGQVVTKKDLLCQHTGLTQEEAESVLKKLVMTNELHISTIEGNEIITVANYDYFMGKELRDDNKKLGTCKKRIMG